MYNLHKLGWYGFQELSLTIAREVFGQTTLSFLPSNDAGRDGSFTGIWHPNGKEKLEGTFVFQCKFTSKANYNLKLSDLKDEFPKAQKLASEGNCDIYVLITNAGVSGVLERKIQEILIEFNINSVLVFGYTWITQIIQENRRLRRLVPRIYGLGDLSQILDERVYRQGKALLDYLKDDLAKIVITNSYKKAATALDTHGFVLIIGEPAAGKTTIASLLAMGALDQWGALTMKLDTAEKVIEHWNPDDPNQFFWIDDAFGVTQYERTLVHEWNRKMLQVKAMISKGAKVVMTSRDYIYNRARQDLKESVFPLLNESQVVVDVHQLTLTEKRQILYNHLKMGFQTKEFKIDIKPFLDFIANLPGFIPEIARRLASSTFTEYLSLNKWYLRAFVNKPEKFLMDIIIGLDKDCQAAFALIYMNKDKLRSPINLKDYESESIERMGSNLGGCTTALKAMKGSLVQIVHGSEHSYWKFKHPTIGDSFSLFVMQNPELIEIYLQGSEIEKLLEQVTCGNLGIENAIIVPKSFYPLVIHRLQGFTSTTAYKTEFLSKWGAKRRLHEFLSSRCSKVFLSIYITNNPSIIDQVVRPGLMLASVSEVDLAFTFFKNNLLPEEHRKIFIQTVSDYAITGEDLYAIESKNIRSMFNDSELRDLKENIKLNLIPNIDKLRLEKQSNFDEEDNADYHMQTLLDIYNTIQFEFKENKEIKDKIEEEIEKVNRWIDENTLDKIMPERESLADDSTDPISNDERSIFDDIDE